MTQGTDICQTATVQNLASCLVRHLQARRAVLLEQLPLSGGPLTEGTRRLSGQLEGQMRKRGLLALEQEEAS